MKELNILIVAPRITHEDLHAEVSSLHTLTHGEVALCESIDEAFATVENIESPFHMYVIDSKTLYGSEHSKSIFDLMNVVSEKSKLANVSPLIVELKNNERETADWATHRYGTPKFKNDYRKLLAEVSND